MKRNRISYGLVFFGILMLSAGVVFGNSVFEKLKDMSGRYSMNKIGVSIKGEAHEDRNSSFTLDDIDKLSTFLKITDLTCAAEKSLSLKVDNTTREVNVKGVNYNYTDFLSLNIKRGSFLTKVDEDERSRVVVIDEELALDLFKTDRVIGKSVEILNKKFKIIGVVSQEESIIHNLTDKNGYNAYVPVNVLLELEQGIGITSLQIKAPDNDLLGKTKDKVTAALSSIGKISNGYIIEDYHIKAAGVRQIPVLIVFIPGFILIVVLLIMTKNKIKELYVLISAIRQREYLSTALKSNSMSILYILMNIGVCITGIVLIWKGIRFEVYFPREYIPEELIDLSFYVDLFKEKILQANSLMGYIPPVEELIYDKAQTLIYWAFGMGVILGIPLIYIGLYQLKQQAVSTLMPIFFCSIFFACSIAIVSVMTIPLGLPLSFSWSGLVVLYTYLFVNSILFSNFGGS